MFEIVVTVDAAHTAASGYVWQAAHAAVPGTDGGLLATDEPMRSISLCGADGLPLRNRSRRSVVNGVPVGIPD